MSETYMDVEQLDYENQEAVITSPKTKTTFTVYKPRYNYQFFKVRTNTGRVADELSGDFSTLQKGIDAVGKYLKNSEISFAVKSDILAEERRIRNASKPNPSDSKQANKGLDN